MKYTSEVPNQQEPAIFVSGMSFILWFSKFEVAGSSISASDKADIGGTSVLVPKILKVKVPYGE